MNNPFKKPQVNPGVALHFANQEHLDRWTMEQVFTRASHLVKAAIEDADVVKVASLAELLDRAMNTEVSDTGVSTNPDLAGAKKALVSFFNPKGK